MKNDNKISVIITCHNYGRFLNQAIDSALFQSVKPKEIIVINDASDDNTDEVARSFEDKIKYYVVDFKNAQKTRNFGLKKSSGEYVVYLDADDYLREDFLYKMQKEMENDDELLLVYSDRNHIGDEKILDSVGAKELWRSEDYSYENLMRYNYISITSLIRRDKFTGFDEDINRFQDWEAWLTLLKGGNAKRIPEPLFTVRFHGENKTIKVGGMLERVKILTKHHLIDVLVDDLNVQKDNIHIKEKEIEEKNKEIEDKNKKIKEKNIEIEKKNEEIEEKNKEILLLKSSKFWKLRNFYLKVKHYFIFIFLNPRKFFKKYFK